MINWVDDRSLASIIFVAEWVRLTRASLLTARGCCRYMTNQTPLFRSIMSHHVLWASLKVPPLPRGWCCRQSQLCIRSYILEQYIKDAWRVGDVVSALFLDIQAAFPNMQKMRLLENMRARNISGEYCNFVDM